MNSKLRWGIAGPGIIANKFAQCIKNVDCAELTSVASRSLDKAKEFAQKYDIPNAFGSYEDMAKSDKIDAVYISTLHPFHRSCAELFLNAGKHVLCEKPLCVNAYQAKKLSECAKKNKLFLMEGMWTRFLPAIKEAQRIVESGMIGEVREITADFCYSCAYDEDPKLYENHLAGGSLLDVGVYGLHFASLFLDSEAESVHAASQIERNVDGHTRALMQYKNGAVVTISSAINLYKPEDAYIYGTKGYIRIPLFYGAQELFIHVNGKTEHIKKPSIGEGFEEEIYEACECIRCGKLESDTLPLSETIRIIELMDEIRRQTGVKYPLEGEV